MSFYFHISIGLRGCYSPSDSYVIRVETRRELREAIESEAKRYTESGYRGGNQKAISAVAAEAWRMRKRESLPYCLPVAPPHAPKNYCEGVFVSAATRGEWKAYTESELWEAFEQGTADAIAADLAEYTDSDYGIEADASDEEEESE